MKLRISKITEQAKDRPSGYFEDVISRGTLDGDSLEISPEALAELRAIYRPPAAPLPLPVIDEPPLPSIWTMAASLGSAAISEITAHLSGTVPLDDIEIARRLAICRAPCQYYRVSDDRCSECGCIGNFKTRLRSQECPRGFW